MRYYKQDAPLGLKARHVALPRDANPDGSAIEKPFWQQSRRSCIKLGYERKVISGRRSRPSMPLAFSAAGMPARYPAADQKGRVRLMSDEQLEQIVAAILAAGFAAGPGNGRMRRLLAGRGRPFLPTTIVIMYRDILAALRENR